MILFFSVRVKGTNVNHQHMIEDGLGMHNENTSNLTNYSQTTQYSSIHNTSNVSNYSQRCFNSSEFDAHKLDRQHQLRRCMSTSTHPEPQMLTTAVVPEYRGRCYPAGKETQSNQKRLLSSPAAFDDNDMRFVYILLDYFYE